MLYDYICGTCGKKTEATRTVVTRHNCPPCEHCGGETTKSVTVTAVHFKGMGWPGADEVKKAEVQAWAKKNNCP